MQGGAKGPGIFFILPCIDSYARVDLRTRTYDVPPQEVKKQKTFFTIFLQLFLLNIFVSKY
ncbi:band 7 protein AGAP004871-like [Lucilia cuprina]|uniref:band 7 protein AGAP004871-like n=1 Tax=Lucilia cuprina TaxID=7375 RepID=UPI001F0523F6|nr:band 7 protein AGAP004871-like [Lucilia cuprina]